ncbi:MAG: hypothetical protein K0R62_6112 [Nonomuraea muscovyensis]|uniref:Uncharacterized protein n=1 Tax=Nonomuraea muscovyensis TaxID=1124761 RepID=A0A7X0C823_9ACTN|nr:hypothetical protein [Nonomuraea muscovyensis]MDF2710460.1 hypothetical protein [Nonomuraea muscovyensis]
MEKAGIDASAEGIHRLLWVMNPAKLDAYAQSRTRGHGRS